MKRVIKNLITLSFIQAIGFITPLILSPIIISRIGIEMFGVVATAQGIIIFFNLFTDFGFNITTIRRIISAKNDRSEIEKIINSVFFLKLLLLFVAFIFYCLLITYVSNFRKYHLVYLLSFTIVLGQALLPVWYYQAIDKLQKTTLPIFLLKLASIPLIIIFVHNENDAMYVNLIYGLMSLIAGIILHVHIFRSYIISTKKVNFNLIRQEVQSNTAIFASSVCNVLYSNSAIVILSFFVSPAAVGVYSIAEKFIQLLKSFLIIVHNSTYPKLCSLYTQGYGFALAFIKRFYVGFSLFIFILCITIYYSSDYIAAYFISDFRQASLYIKYLSFWPLIICLNMPFYQSILAWGKDAVVLKISIITSIISLILTLCLLSIVGITGVIFVLYISEMIGTTSYVYSFFKMGRKIVLP